ncbi:hypothetical protein MJL30_39425, partial [Salmonella enterica subsp. enterica serovar Anatum]|nr:hypothetical protein [Salmonella enterica subsp. enterica serovar Anatum]
MITWINKYLRIAEERLYQIAYIDTYLRTYEVTLGLEPDKAISELNNIFHEHSLKYRYENGRI